MRHVHRPFLTLSFGALLGAAGCAGEATPGALGAGDEGDSQTSTGKFSEQSAVVGQDARVTAQSGLNLRSGPSTGYAILRVMSHGTVVHVSAADNGWYKVNDSGTVGWCSGAFLTPLGAGAPPPDPAPNPNPAPNPGPQPNPSNGNLVDEAMARAQSGVGFSYHWGAGCWAPGQAHGACYGSCPNCSHNGEWGADCSGYASKVWQVPGRSPTESCSHPYSTWNFYNTHDHWYDVRRGDVKRGDAFVYNSGSSGHIFLYDGGDAWGWVTAYECKGCSYGCVKDTRQAYSVYKAIRREGF